METQKLLVDQIYDLLNKTVKDEAVRDALIQCTAELKCLLPLAFKFNQNRNRELVRGLDTTKKGVIYITDDLTGFKKAGYIKASTVQQLLNQSLINEQSTKTLGFNGRFIRFFVDSNKWIDEDVFNDFIKNKRKIGIRYTLDSLLLES